MLSDSSISCCKSSALYDMGTPMSIVDVYAIDGLIISSSEIFSSWLMLLLGEEITSSVVDSGAEIRRERISLGRTFSGFGDVRASMNASV